MILPPLIGIFRLQEQIRAFDDTSAIGRSQAFSHARFEIMPPLVGSINPAESRAQSQFCKTRGAVFLPGSSIKKMRRGENWRHRTILSRSHLCSTNFPEAITI